MNVNEARGIVEQYLRDEYRDRPYELVVLDALTQSQDFGWVFFFNSREFVETGELGHALGGNPPLLVDRETGELHVLGTAYPIEEYLDEFRQQWEQAKARAQRKSP